MVLELREFQPATLRAFVESVPNENEYRLSSAFPDENVYDDNFIYNIMSNTPVIGSKVTGFNSSAPIRSMAEAKQAMGKITKLQDAYFIDEKTDRQITAPRQGTDERQAAIARSLKDVGNLAIGVDDTLEYLRAKLVYDGIVEYTDKFTQTKVSFVVDRPEENDFNVSPKWNAENSNPFEDILEAVEQYKKSTKTRNNPARIDIASDVELALMKNGMVKQLVYGSADDGRIVTPEQLRSVFSQHNLPEYYVNRDQTTFEDIVDGERVLVTKDHLESGKVVLYDEVMGFTARGDVKVDGVYRHGKFVQTYTEPNPERETIIVGEAAIPALQAVNNNVIMTVL